MPIYNNEYPTMHYPDHLAGVETDPIKSKLLYMLYFVESALNAYEGTLRWSDDPDYMESVLGNLSAANLNKDEVLNLLNED